MKLSQLPTSKVNKSNFFTPLDSTFNNSFWADSFNQLTWANATAPKKLFNLKNKSSEINFNLYKQEDSYKLNVALPGISKKDVTVSVEGNTLKVTVDLKDSESLENNVTEYLVKGFETSYNGVLELDVLDSIELSNVSSKMENGILYIDLPNKEKEIQTITID